MDRPTLGRRIFGRLPAALVAALVAVAAIAGLAAASSWAGRGSAVGQPPPELAANADAWPAHDYDPENTPDGRTGKPLWFRQAIPHDVRDDDPMIPAIVTTVRIHRVLAFPASTATRCSLARPRQASSRRRGSS